MPLNPLSPTSAGVIPAGMIFPQQINVLFGELMLWWVWCRITSTLFSTTRKRAPGVGSTLEPKWWSNALISRQWILQLNRQPVK
ncbi:hypothetical protein [Crenothrix polyspora]|uniref:hypothetical protein n=1 Tax=Crenothrix polyspora TaxID=360316 RepID=UPI0015941E1B|nr:hypothetical protein [Crenothrix polyspora]